jgi:ABC-2 type transport system ATP-binding protein
MIKIKHLSFGYGSEQLFRRMDLTLEAGRIYGLLGLNGAGKSTLLKLMTGLLFADRGIIDTLGYAPARREPGMLARIFMLPEELNVPGITGEQYVQVLSPFYPAFDHSQLQRCLEQFEIPSKKRLTALSHGQKKKFLLAFGLATNSELLVLDEPTNGLDIPSKGLFRRLVAEALNEDRVIVISTHQVRDVESLIDSIVVLHEGKVLFSRSMFEVTSTIRMEQSVSPAAADAEGLVYTEPAVGGYWNVWSGGDEDGHIDLEVLFNASIADPVVLRAAFSNRGVAA